MPEVMEVEIVHSSGLAGPLPLMESHVPEHFLFRKKIANVPIAAIGYFGMKSDVEMKDEGAYITLQSQFDLRKGKIVRRYGSKGPGLHQWPCFQCDIAFDHGMSGGPIVYYRPDETIVACGVISSDFTFEVNAGTSDSHAIAGMLWPVMSLGLPNTMIDGVASEPSLLELQSRGLIEDLGNASEHIRQTIVEGDGEITKLYRWV